MDEMKNNTPETEGESAGESSVEMSAGAEYNSGDSDFSASAEFRPQEPIQPQGGYY